MNYCSIEDAWGKSEYISEQFKNYENPFEKKNIIENFEPNNKINNDILNKARIITCADMFNHIDNCYQCRMRIKSRYSSRMLGKLENVIFNNKDFLILFLVGLFIIVLLNLLLNIFRG